MSSLAESVRFAESALPIESQDNLDDALLSTASNFCDRSLWAADLYGVRFFAASGLTHELTRAGALADYDTVATSSRRCSKLANPKYSSAC